MRSNFYLFMNKKIYELFKFKIEISDSFITCCHFCTSIVRIDNQTLSVHRKIRKAHYIHCFYFSLELHRNFCFAWKYFGMVQTFAARKNYFKNIKTNISKWVKIFKSRIEASLELVRWLSWHNHTTQLDHSLAYSRRLDPTPQILASHAHWLSIYNSQTVKTA